MLFDDYNLISYLAEFINDLTKIYKCMLNPIVSKKTKMKTNKIKKLKKNVYN